MDGKPILFSAPMVRALLDGSKTQTRRVVKIPYHAQIEDRDDGKPWPWMYNADVDDDHWFPCPYGQPGDRLWVREAWRASSAHNNLPPRDIPEGDAIHYQADGFARIFKGKCRPSMFMPRWASRITLEITDVRVERLRDISREDAEAEGWNPAADVCSPLVWYAALWQSINGPGSWALNPWVWVVSFKVVKP